MILFFNLIGYFMLAEFNQGQDVLRTLGFFSINENGPRHTLMVCILLMGWGWQNWRSARVITHFKDFHFSEFYKTYSIRTLVLIPRLFAVLPFIIISRGTYIANHGFVGLIWVFLLLGIGLFSYLHFRRKIIVYLMTKNLPIRFLLDYIPVKNDAYPASFIISKQKWWIMQRFLTLFVLFSLIIMFPISFSTFLGSTAIVILSITSWLVFFTLLSLYEHRYKIPFVFILFICFFSFSYINNNHQIRELSSDLPDKRPTLDAYIQKWLRTRYNGLDTLEVELVACEGGGIRAAYWSNEVLSELSIRDPKFKEQILAFSSVSGGSLGTMAFNMAAQSESDIPTARNKARQFLKNDFLSPIMAYAMFPDALQRFLPFPITGFDRAAILEKTWEASWEKSFEEKENLFKEGFISCTRFDKGIPGPMIFLNATHIETGKRVLVSPVQFGDNQFYESTDLLKTINRDIPSSTAVLLSARFPYLTPAGLIVDREGKKWGHVGDGGYYENLGISTLLDVYTRLRAVSDSEQIPVKVNFIFIRNTKDFSKTTPLTSMYELMAPIEGYLNVWYKSGGYNLNMIRNISLKKNDKILNFDLPRFENDIIPLGWSLSKQATGYIDSQVAGVVEAEMKRQQLKR